MVYTLTLNPSIDYIVEMEEFLEGKVNRTKAEKILPGGKGINVSWVLKNLGTENSALGIISGFTGNIIEEETKKLGIKTDFLVAENGFSRINVKIKAEEETEINGQGPKVLEEELKKLYKKLDKIKENDFLVLAGSVPKTLPKTIYSDIMEYLKPKKLNIIVDTTGESLTSTLKHKPFLIKPNNFELGEIFGVQIKTEDDVIKYSKKLQDMGALNVLVSLGGDGALLLCENGEVKKCDALDGKVINTTGAGDSLVAGFITGFIETKDYDYALKLGVASGCASAFSENLATGEEIRGIFNKIL